jgi:3-oxoacyl-[acyl-carrier-protein] synthase II
MSKRKVVVTGLGIVSPIGNGIAEAWPNLLKGTNGVGPITRFERLAPADAHRAEVKGFNAADWMPLKETRRSDTFIHYGLAATRMALDDAAFTIDESNAERVGVNVGSGIGGCR